MATTDSKRNVFLVGCIAFISVCSLLLQPRLQASLFPQVRLSKASLLARSVREQRSVDPFLFWQIRDEYGAGFFTLSADHTIFRETQELLIPPKTEWIKFSSYQSRYVSSDDYLTPWNTLLPTQYSQFLDRFVESGIPKERSIFQNENTRVFLSQKDQLVVAFVKPISEMARVNGLYNFPAQKMKEFDGRLWVSVTTFKVTCCSQDLLLLTEAAPPKK